MKFYTDKSKNLVELISIAIFSWCIGFLIFFLGGAFLLDQTGIIETFDEYEKKVEDYVGINIKKPEYSDYTKNRTNLEEMKENYGEIREISGKSEYEKIKTARENFEKASKEYYKKSSELKQEYREKNPRRDIDSVYLLILLILLIGVLPGAFTLLIGKKYNDNLVLSIEIENNNIIITKKNKKSKNYILDDYFVQLFTTTVISWKCLFIPYKLYHINLFDQNGKNKTSIYLDTLYKKDVETVLEFIKNYQEKYKVENMN